MNIQNTENNSNSYSNSNKSITDKSITDTSPFKTTYISREEGIESKNTNNALYSQFHHARQAIYQQYKCKIDQILSNMLTQPKRKLQIKIAAIDAKVQEKKLFLSYLEMSKPQPNSWLISNSAISINTFNNNNNSHRKINNNNNPNSSYSTNTNTIIMNNHNL